MSEIIQEKVSFISDNKELLIENLNLVGYQLFLILNSDKSLNEISAYQNLKLLLENKEITSDIEEDDNYIIYSLIAILNKVVMNEQEKQKCINKLCIYLEYINNMRNQKVKKSSKIVA